MHWVFLALAVGALAVAFTTPHMWLLVVGLIVALLLILMWVRGWYLSRMGDSQHDVSSMIDPTELRRLREQAEARKAAAASGEAEGESGPISR